MKIHGLAVSLLATLAFSAGDALATATLGGVTSALAGSGVCNDTKSVPLNTPQNTLLLASATACNGGTASAGIHGEAATGTVGLRGSSSGNGFGSSMVAATVGLNDYWLLAAPAGTAANTTIRIPVTLRLDGTISPGAKFDPTFGSFISYNLSISDHYSPLSPAGHFSAIGSVSATGAFSQTFIGNVDFSFFGASSALPMRADIALSLSIASLLEGTVDFYNTAAISMDLPAGFSALTSSGVPLVFAPVPEPETWLMLLAGMGLISLYMRRHRTASIWPGHPA